MKRRTPCVGVCSTTYGDLVCRGCKRFAHEIVGWNGYRESQRELVWTRLHTLLAQSVGVFLGVADERELRAVAKAARVADADVLPAEVLAFHTMRSCPLALRELGLASRSDATETPEVVRMIDREFYLRSCAHFEASFKTPAA